MSTIPEYHADPFGEPWDPSDSASPHAFDYKFNIFEPKAQRELLDLIAAEQKVPGSQLLSLEWLRQRGQTVRYLDSQIKRGCFIQAGCVVTNGFESGKTTHVLLYDRSENQFHDPKVARRTAGWSAIGGTVFASFVKQDPFGHAPTALFNDLRDHCPWALFSRKLLLPDVLMDSRFLGMAYNFKDPGCRYIFLLWHVRTKQMPEALIVPARQTRKHDVPVWFPVGELAPDALGDKPMERLALGAVLGRPFGETPAVEKAGFVPWPKFEEIWKPLHLRPAIVQRDTIILDLLRMYQQEFHGGRRSILPATLETDKESALHKDLLQYLNDRIDRFKLPFKLTAEVPLGLKERGAGRTDIIVESSDYAGSDKAALVHYRFMIECKLSGDQSDEHKYLDQVRAYQAAVAHVDDRLRHDYGFHAIVLLHGLRGLHHRFPLQVAESYPHPATPIHVVRVALTPAAPSSATPAKEVVHGIIPFRSRVNGVNRLLFTKQDKDPNSRLPGGKVEPGENLVQAIRRELKEELGLLPQHILDLIPVKPGDERSDVGFSVSDVSMKTGEETLYSLHPFIVVLTPLGKQHVVAGLNQGKHCPRPAPINSWLEGEFGHKKEYAQTVRSHLPPELLEQAALDIDD